MNVDVGLWLLARLAVHHAYNTLPKNRQQPLTGLGLSDADWLEVMRLQLELARLGRSGPGAFR